MIRFHFHYGISSYRMDEHCGVDFMYEWIDDNVTDAWRPASREFVAALFSLCFAATAAQGITMRDIEEELGTDVRTVIFEALMNDPNDEFEALAKGRRN